MRGTTDMVHVLHDGTTSTDGAIGIVTKGLTLRLLMSYIYIYIYIYMEHLFLMFLQAAAERTPLFGKLINSKP